ncbi:endo alpha-1,4 polygalactosaminidase [Thermococcus sp. SY098]|uniref:endo alpha-1,4 polygalactosaminidase n=1 Tax=Thermococcus sp. SY098 TaxID=3111325 RepID=UPI002D79C81C|nr:endo alpha-1,4 polygalactosaminidase [Thermococcus sp. SY098]WRS52552.1 endo alpha-1,4 polygalactosaminidase [Thermococcus sp. SY098]
MKRYLTFIVFILIFLQPLVYASFAVYYGDVSPSNIGELSKFNLLILSPLVGENYIKELKAKNVTVVGYLSLATIGGWEPWAEDVPDSIIIGHWETWNEKEVDFSSPQWMDIVLNEAVPYILSKGFDGVFLDNLDYVDKYPEKREAMVKLIKAIREKYPDIVIVANRGFSITKEIAPYVDYVLFEDFITYYDFNDNKYKIYQDGDLQWVLAQAEMLKKLKVKVLALSYVDLDNEKEVEEFSKIVCKYADEYGFEVYMADITLQRIGFNPCENFTKSQVASSEAKIGEENKNICGSGSILLVIFLPRSLRELILR